jgi:hypothetical protein
MKKLVLFFCLLMALCACQVRHDHSKRMQQVRVALDSTQKNDVQAVGIDSTEHKEGEAMDEEDDALLDIPDIPEEAKTVSNPATMREMELMLQGKDTE